MLEVRSALADVAIPGRYGAIRPEGPGVRLAEVRGRALLQLAGWPDSFASAIDRLIGVIGDGHAVVPVGAERVWILADAPAIGDRLRGAFTSGEAVVLDLSHSRTVLTIEGRRVREVLAKGVPVDLHTDTFTVGAAAQTVVDHVGVLIRGVGPERFEIYVPRSYARSFWHWIAGSAAEFGYIVE